MTTAAEARTQHAIDLRVKYRDKQTEKLADKMHLATMLARRAPKQFNPYQVAVDAAMLKRAAKSIAALAVASCNYGLSQRQETRRNNLAKRCNEIAAVYDLTAHCHGDPRGFTVRLTGRDVPANGWGEGFGVA